MMQVGIGRLMMVMLMLCSAAQAGPLADGKYIKVRDGHLWYDGGRIRLWGTNFCSTIKRTGSDLELCFDRLADVGFNGIRVNMFDDNFVNNEAASNSYTIKPSVKGDGSQLDLLDYSISLARQRGMFFWLQFDRARTPAREADYDIMPEPTPEVAAAGLDGSRQEWAELVKECGDLSHLIYIDPRAERVYQAYAKALLDHVNPYTGKRWAEEETIALWELHNENRFVEWVISVQPAGVLKKRLTARWNAWLRERYKTDDALVKAWGKLNDGESLADGTVEYAPTTGGVEVSGAGVQKEYAAKDVKLGSYPYTRGEDIARFAMELYIGHTQRFIAYVRSLAPEGVGINVSPIAPTGRYGASLQNYCASASGDFCAMGGYGFAVRPWEVKPDHPYYPYVVRVNEHPLMEQPIDLIRVKDKPHLIYECNDTRPNPYTVEFHTRMLAFAAWQDYDGVFWFTWDDSSYLPDLKTDEDYLSHRMPIPDSSYPNAGLTLANDEAALASLKAMGAVFKTGAIQPAENPVEVTIGKDFLLNLADPGLGCLEDLPELARLLRPVIWRYGIRTVFDMDGPSKFPAPVVDTQTRLAMGNSVVFDWTNLRGYIRIDTPSAKVYTGFLPAFLEFDGGISIKHIDRQWGTIALVAEDGKPLDQSKSVLVTAVSRNMNTGMEVTPERLSTSDYWQQGMAQMCGEPGVAPPVVDRIGCVIRAPWLKGMTFTKHDFKRKCFEEGQVGDSFVLRGYEPTFYARLTRPQPRVVRKLLVIGNSLAKHGPNPEALGWNGSWGMAATAMENDYAHVLYRHLCQAQPEPQPELIVENLNAMDLPSKTEEFKVIAAAHQADLVLIQIGDNLSVEQANEETLTNPYEKLLIELKQANGDAMIFGVSMWGACPKRNELMQKACRRQNVPWLNISNLLSDPANWAKSEGHFTHSGVNWHPGDRGMKAIADTLWEQMQPFMTADKQGQ